MVWLSCRICGKAVMACVIANFDLPSRNKEHGLDTYFKNSNILNVPLFLMEEMCFWE